MSNLQDLRALTPAAFAVALAACASPAPTTAPEPARPKPPFVVGSDRDAHGCKASAGYTWCEREGTCVRPWELARQKGFETGGDAFERYCRAVPKCDETAEECRREGSGDGAHSPVE